MNETIKTQLNHRTIRAFKNQELTDEQKKTLEEVARHTSTSMFLQQFSMMHKNAQKSVRLRGKNMSAQTEICSFLLPICTATAKFVANSEKTKARFTGPMFSCRQLKIRFWPCKISSMRLKAWDLAPLF